MPVNDSQMSHTVAVFSKNLTSLVKNKMNGLPFSQSQFAKENNLGTTALNQWCNGRRFPSDENLDRLCEIFQVPLAELFIEPGQSINADNKNSKIDKIDKIETAVAGNDLNVSQLHENINAILSNGAKEFVVNFLTDRLSPMILPNDSLLCTSPNSLNNGCTTLCLFDRQFAICSVKTEGNKFVFTNLNSPSQSWQLESSAAYSSVLGIVLKLSRNF